MVAIFVQTQVISKMSIRSIIFILVVFGLSSCRPSFDKDYYERISGIKFPKKIQIIETHDNGEFFTTTSLKVDSLELKAFIKQYKFEQLNKIYPSQFLGQNALKKVLPDFNNLQNLYFKIGSRRKNSWFYVIDLKQQVLWAEIQYPDWGGD